MRNFLVQLNNLKLKIEKSRFLFWVLILVVLFIIVTVTVLNFSTIISTQAAAGINPQITYQGKLANASGVSVTTGNYNFQFQLYDAANSGNVLWTETWTATTTAGAVGVTRGVFSANLGTSTSLSTVDFNVDTLYLQVAFDSDSNGSFEEVFSPRKRITAAPYAFNTDTVDGFHATSTATAGQLLALDINKGLSLNSVTTTGSFYGGGYASTTLGFYTQGLGHYGSNLTVDGTLKVGAYTLPNTDGTVNYVLKTNGLGALTWQADNTSGTGVWATTSEQYFWNNTTTWAYYDTNWARKYNATTTLNGFTPANYLSAASYYATTTWAGGNNNLTVTGFASSTEGLFTQGNGHYGGNLIVDSKLGIGTTNPFGALHAMGTEATVYDGTNGNAQELLGVTLAAQNTNTTVGSFSQILLRNRSSAVADVRLVSILRGGGYSDFAITTENGSVASEKFRVTGDGFVGITTSTPKFFLTVEGQNGTNGILQVATTTNQNIFVINNDGHINASGNLIMGGYASSTTGLYTQGDLHVGGASSFDGILSGTGWTTSNQNFWNSTTTWAYYDTNWARKYNATTTLNGFTPANYLSAASYYATTTWAGGNNNLTVTGYASSTAGLFTQNNLHVGGTATFDGVLSGTGWNTANQNFWNTTSTWAYYDVNWARNYNATTTLNGLTISNYFLTANFASSWATQYNATTTLNGFTPANYLLTSNFNSSFDAQLIATSTWSGDLIVDGNATTTGNLNVGGGSGGDSFIELAVSGVSTWAFGVDVSASNRFVFSASGVLGTSNAFQLDTLGNATTTGRLVVGSTNPVSDYGALYVNSGVGGGAAYLVGGVTTTDSFYAGGYASTTGGLYTQGALRAGGQVSINTAANTTYALTLPNSAVTQTGYGIAKGWSTYSDSRIKTEQRSLDYGLDEVLKLAPKRYTQHGSEFVDGELVLGNGNETIGLIAQEVFGVIPEVVGRPDDDSKSLWSINYSSLIPVIINAIQELSIKIDQLANNPVAPVINNISNVVINNATPVSQTPQITIFDYSRYTNVLTVKNDLVKLDHDMVVAGNTYLNNTLSVATDSEFKGNISIGHDATFYGTITILGEAGFKYTVVFEKEVEFQDHITVDHDTAGTAIVSAGATSTEIMFAKDFKVIPKVVISANSLMDINYAVTEKSLKSFRISLSQTVNQDIEFDWLALATKDNNQNPTTPEVAGTSAVAGCRDATANNYNSLATEDNGLCTYLINSPVPEPEPVLVPASDPILVPDATPALESTSVLAPEPVPVAELAPDTVSETTI